MTCGAQVEQIGNLLSVGRRWSGENGFSSGSWHSCDYVDRELRLTTIHDPPYTNIRLLPDGSYHYTGYLVDVWKTIAENLKLRYRIESPTDGGYGSLDDNGIWTGMVGEIAYGRADVSLSWLYIRPDRTEVLEYLDSVAVETAKETFYIPRSSGDIPDFSTNVYRSLLKPLDMSIWWTLLVSIFVLSTVLRAAVRANRSRAENNQTVSDMTWGSCLLSTFMAMVGQGWEKTPDSFAARTVTIFSWMLGIVIYTSYTTNLISHLTVANVERPISSLEEFSRHSDWTLAVQLGHGVLNDWKDSHDRHLRELSERSATGEGYTPITSAPENIHRLTQPKVMAYASRFKLLSITGNHSCRMVTLEETAVYQNSDGFLTMAKGMPKLQADVNRLLRKLHEQGVLYRLKNQWLSQFEDEKKCEEVNGSRALSIVEFLPILAVIAHGFVVSVLLLAAEWGCAKFTMAKRSWSTAKRSWFLTRSVNHGATNQP